MKKVQVLLAIILIVGVSLPVAARKKVRMDKLITRSIPHPTSDSPIEVYLENDNTLTIIFYRASDNVSVNIRSMDGSIRNNTGLTVNENDVLTFDLPESSLSEYQLFVEIDDMLLTGIFQAI